jgi:flagellar protein FliL
MTKMAEAEQAAVPETKKKNKLVLWLVLGAVLALMGGGGFLARKYFTGSQAAPDQGAGAKERAAIHNVKSVMNLDAFLVNLGDTETTRFVKVTFRLGLDDAKSGEEYTSDAVILAATRDKIISLLSVKTAEELLSPDGKERLRSEIREKVNLILPKGKILEVYIMDFVVQL